MSVQTVTLQLPETLYRHLKARADRTRRTVEDELLDVLVTAVPASDELPADLAEAIAPLAALDDAALWRAARSRFPTGAAARLEQLHLKRQREGLTEGEEQAAAALVREYERAMLVRAQATALLKQRGHDISVLLTAR